MTKKTNRINHCKNKQKLTNSLIVKVYKAKITFVLLRAYKEMQKTFR